MTTLSGGPLFMWAVLEQPLHLAGTPSVVRDKPDRLPPAHRGGLPRRYGTREERDANQTYVVGNLSDLRSERQEPRPGFGEQLDLLVGYAGRTYWYELKCQRERRPDRERRYAMGMVDALKVVRTLSGRREHPVIRSCDELRV